MWPISTVLTIVERLAAARAGVAGGHLPEVVEFGLEILAGGDVAQVVVVAVGAGDHVAAALQRLVGQDGHVGHAHRAERAGVGAEPVADLLGVRGAEVGVAGGAAELGLAQLVVAAQQRQHGLAVGHQHQALHLRGFGQAGEFGDLARWSCGRACGTPRARGRLRGRRRRARRAARRPSPGWPSSRTPADHHVVLAGFGSHHELVRLAAAHGAGVRLDRDVLQAAAVEDAAVGAGSACRRRRRARRGPCRRSRSPS